MIPMNYLVPRRCRALLRPLTALLTLLALVFSPMASAADAGTGTIEGRVRHGATGTYIGKARVAVGGTNIEVMTNDFGEYRITGVPAGEAQVQVRYTGQPTMTATVTVPAGGTVQHNVELTDNATIEMGEFVVESERYQTAQEIAINEERYSVNIKNVVSAEQFGDIPSGNIGEFIKFLPGIELTYGGTYSAPTDAAGISVRGFGPQDTAIYIDGVPVASASQASLTTQIELDMLSINNASRVELIKVATPDMPMNSVGGQINLISKSAFEYSKPTFMWKAYVTINSEYPNPFEKVAGSRDEKVYAGQPGFEFSYIRPINEKFGLTITGSMFRQFSVNRRFRPEWGTSNVNVDMRPFGGANNTPMTNALGPVSLANPYLTRVSIEDAPRSSTSYSLSLKGDWRPIEGLTLTGTYQASMYESADAKRRIQIRTQRPMTWDETSTISLPYLQPAQSATGSAFNPGNNIEMNVDSRDKEGITHTGSLRATYRRGGWDVFALASASTSRASFKDFENGHFSTVDVNANSQIGQVKFEEISGGVPGKITVLDRNGNVFDFSDLSKWNTPTIQGRSGLAESMDDVFNYKIDVRRELDFLPWQEHVKFGVKAGFLREETLKKKWGRGTGYRETYTGAPLTVADYLDTTYEGYSPGWGLAPQQWISTYRLYDIYEQADDGFGITESDAREIWFSAVGQNKSIKETKDAYYAMIDGSAMRNRLSFVAGVRQENASRVGRGPQGDGKWNYIKNSDGSLYRNTALVPGAGTVRIDQANSLLFANSAAGDALRADLQSKSISFPTAVVTTSSLTNAILSRRMLVPVYGKSKGKASPSINLAYNITENLVAKLAWSKSFGRIPLEDATRGILSGNQNDFNINEAESPTAIPRGVISVANPNLLPEISTNWDFALSYYTSNGGKLGASIFLKDIENFSENVTTTSASPEFATVLDSLGLDPTEYQDWELRTSVNGVGVGKVKGYELELMQDLRFIPGDWGRRINVFATYSHTKREENGTNRISARPAASDLATAGINLGFNRLSLSLKGTWRDLTYVQSRGEFTIGGITYVLGEFDPATTKVDLNAEYRMTDRYSLFLSGRDIFNEGMKKQRFDLGGIYPTYAHTDDIRDFGVQLTFGIKGRF